MSQHTPDEKIVMLERAERDRKEREAKNDEKFKNKPDDGDKRLLQGYIDRYLKKHPTQEKTSILALKIAEEIQLTGPIWWK